ncbi:YncE family protein [Limnospira platensis]|uniref:YncE family protein n=1 Tax=Limnospira platensis TaxID=118562 RepID=UPI0002803FE8|nr:40-residue YVTN family beta-propeller repeat protein [Arthrospira platensis C1]UWU47469.1 YVTN family beta-propeller repeat-containing protein [Arthrospira platensis C1]
MNKLNKFHLMLMQKSGKTLIIASISLVVLTLTAIRLAVADSGSDIFKLGDRIDFLQQKLSNHNSLDNSESQETIAFLPPQPGQFEIIKTIKSDNLTPKSVVYADPGMFFVQNMMYEHSIAVYNRQFEQVKKIADHVNLYKFGHRDFTAEKYKGSPVEAAVSQDGKFAYISNYRMYGPEFNNPGHDTCLRSDQFDPSFIYRINTENLTIDNAIKVGSVPKFIAVSPNGKYVLVTNWCSGDVSVIDTDINQEIQRIFVGRFPRGIAISPNSETAYIAVMGTSDIAKIDLQDYSVNWMHNVGLYPRHLVLDSTGKYLYVTLNGDDHVAKIDTETGEIIRKIFTGAAPRSMVLSDDDQFLYVVNYYSHTVSKVQAEDMEIIDTITVGLNPIGITYDPKTRQVWVACYTGSLVVIQD